MNLLLVGSGKGAWTIRGVQLGHALGARVVQVPSVDDWRWAQLVVLVKRAGPTYANVARQHGVPIVWDALDFWSQPADNGRDEAGARQLLASHLAQVRPALFVGATEAMARAGDGVHLPHHCWPGMVPTAARATVETVAYQGNVHYLGAWRGRLEQACARRGWRFLVNPTDLTHGDIVVAFRDGLWDGWMCREWKSGVKLVNALAAGRPVITQRSAAFTEMAPAGGLLVDAAAELEDALDLAADTENRRTIAIAAAYRAQHEVSVSAVATRYAHLLKDVRTRCAA